MTEMYRRRIRVEGKPDALNGFALTITDADTGEMIEHVYGVDLSLRATALNKATVHYYPFDEHGKIVVENDNPVEKSFETDNPEVSLTALETMTELEQLRAEVEMYRDATKGHIQRRRREEQVSVIQAVKEQEEEERKARERQAREDRLRKILRVAFERVNKWPGDFSRHDVKETVDGMMQAIHEYMQE